MDFRLETLKSHRLKKNKKNLETVIDFQKKKPVQLNQKRMNIWKKITRISRYRQASAKLKLVLY